MKSNSSASRTAILIVAAIIAGAFVWIFWPLSDSEVTIEEANSSKGKIITPNDEMDSTLEVTSQLPSQESKPPDKESKDFRMLTDDSYASVRKGNFYTTTGVTDLQPDREMSNFSVGQRVYAYAGIQAVKKETVRITWFDSENKEIPPSAYLDVEPNTGPVGYRVFTYRIFRKSGNYSVVISNAAGVNIAESKFTVIAE